MKAASFRSSFGNRHSVLHQYPRHRYLTNYGAGVYRATSLAFVERRSPNGNGLLEWKTGQFFDNTIASGSSFEIRHSDPRC